MSAFCLPKNLVAKLKKGVTAGDITIQKLESLDSAQRRALLEKYVGKEAAQSSNALFEKALVSNQLQAKRNWIWKNFYSGTPLYSDISLATAQKMKRGGVKVSQLKKLTPEARIRELAKYTDVQTAKNLNKKFEALQKTGNLANWEKRALGSDAMFQDNKLKGAFRKLEVLDDIGILNPAQTTDFMSDLVQMKLGVAVTPQESAKISKLVKKVNETFAKFDGKTHWTNEKNVDAYFAARKALENYTTSLSPDSLWSVFTEVGARGAMLFAFRSVVNSAVFQTIPTVLRAFSKRAAAPLALVHNQKTMGKVIDAMSSSFTSKAQREFMKKQTALNWKIYKKYGYDMSRMQNLDDGMNFFGEKFTHINGPSFKEAKNIKEFFGAGVRSHAKLMQGGMKYAAGGTDTLFGGLHQADTVALLSATVSRNEARIGKLPKGMNQAQRMMQLMEEGTSFKPKTEIGKFIRERGIMDAHFANGTQNDIYSKAALGFRNALDIGNVSLGKVVSPFLKIPANVAGQGIEATGIGLARGTRQIIQGLRIAKPLDRAAQVTQGVQTLMSTIGLGGAAFFLTSLLDADDFIGAYDFRARSENGLSLTKNAGSMYWRMGGNWYSVRWLGPLAVPFSAHMMAKQARARGESAVSGYIAGGLMSLSQFPGLQQLGETAVKVRDSWQPMKSGGLESFAKHMGLDSESLAKFWTARMVPSFINHDVRGLITEKTRYDTLGRPVPKRGDSTFTAVRSMFFGSNVREDTSNAITREFDSLLNQGYLPILTDPSGAKVDKRIEEMGEDEYVTYLNGLKRDYAKEVERTIKSTFYKRLSPEEQKKEIDRIRRVQILNRI